MSSDFAAKWDREQIQEMPMVDLAFEVLKATNTPMYYRDLMMEIAKIRELDPDQINDVIAQVYTEINVDGRFACVGSNNWGLKRWYPIERNEDPITNAKRPRIINDDDDMDDEDIYADEEEESYAAEEDDYDSYDEDRENFEENEEDAEVDEDVAIDDEEIEDDAEGEEISDDESDDFDGDADDSDEEDDDDN
ncbi:DNA-directed RNA polymerase subunit delta [Paenibacillus cellulosilyticus]|uniref:Probable DNA-directed RNA polymerase subunit delta n=1 Tax=Paenibacillus cellulosilyticus TaxID=375489 RepID=A0A2V2YX06_9BACL|nr:DNA-directed RNA polymerase subunit delta [Paenibacillus cellulosilyticus]PWW05286.1 DNA-directed RNA polymerase subunit delta [Paenibacillus cellulosilyticus]QKS43606.1 DNA-directed RNA polymerase subunit delta [Paenibacillus cellulosilyticus]